MATSDQHSTSMHGILVNTFKKQTDQYPQRKIHKQPKHTEHILHRLVEIKRNNAKLKTINNETLANSNPQTTAQTCCSFVIVQQTFIQPHQMVVKNERRKTTSCAGSKKLKNCTQVVNSSSFHKRQVKWPQSKTPCISSKQESNGDVGLARQQSNDSKSLLGRKERVREFT